MSRVVSAARMIMVVGVLLLAYALGPWDRGWGLSVAVQVVLWIVVLTGTVVWQVRAIMHSTHPWLRAVEGAALSVALLLLPLAGIYVALSSTDPAAFTQPLSRIDALYFTVTVFSTVGFGDIAPVAEPARVLVTVQMIADLVLIGAIVKVLVGVAQRRRESLGPRTPRGSAAN